MIKSRSTTKKRKKVSHTSISAADADGQRRMSSDHEDATRLRREAVMHEPVVDGS